MAIIIGILVFCFLMGCVSGYKNPTQPDQFEEDLKKAGAFVGVATVTTAHKLVKKK